MNLMIFLFCFVLFYRIGEFSVETILNFKNPILKYGVEESDASVFL